jgi:hypothetical protein
MKPPKRGKNKIPTDYGMKDYYNFYSEKYNSNMPRTKYNKIISDINQGIIDLMLNEGFEFKIPHINSTIMIKKDKRTPRIVNGKVINPSPVDWVTTRKLWESDPEAEEKKILVRYVNSHTSGYVFRIYLKKFGATFKNRSVYKFKASRKFQRELTARINDENKDRFDTYLLY